jgi:hypothetical protein
MKVELDASRAYMNIREKIGAPAVMIQCIHEHVRGHERYMAMVAYNDIANSGRFKYPLSPRHDVNHHDVNHHIPFFRGDVLVFVLRLVDDDEELCTPYVDINDYYLNSSDAFRDVALYAHKTLLELQGKTSSLEYDIVVSSMNE